MRTGGDRSQHLPSRMRDERRLSASGLSLRRDGPERRHDELTCLCPRLPIGRGLRERGLRLQSGHGLLHDRIRAEQSRRRVHRRGGVSWWSLFDRLARRDLRISGMSIERRGNERRVPGGQCVHR